MALFTCFACLWQPLTQLQPHKNKLGQWGQRQTIAQQNTNNLSKNYFLVISAKLAIFPLRSKVQIGTQHKDCTTTQGLLLETETGCVLHLAHQGSKENKKPTTTNRIFPLIPPPLSLERPQSRTEFACFIARAAFRLESKHINQRTRRRPLERLQFTPFPGSHHSSDVYSPQQ